MSKNYRSHSNTAAINDACYLGESRWTAVHTGIEFAIAAEFAVLVEKPSSDSDTFQPIPLGVRRAERMHQPGQTGEVDLKIRKDRPTARPGFIDEIGSGKRRWSLSAWLDCSVGQTISFPYGNE